MDVYMIVLRLLHILGGVFWIGSVWMLVGFLEPAAAANAPDGQKFLQKLFQGPLAMMTSAAAGLNILTGLLLYWRDSAGLRLDWITTPAGLAFTVGGLAALIAFVIGFIVSKPAADKLGVIGKAAHSADGRPSPEQAAEMQRLQKRVSNAAKTVAVLLTIALIAMAVARYL